MHEHLAAIGEARKRQHAAYITACDDAGRLDHAGIVEGAGETNLTSSSQPNRRSHRDRGGRADSGSGGGGGWHQLEFTACAVILRSEANEGPTALDRSLGADSRSFASLRMTAWAQ